MDYALEAKEVLRLVSLMEKYFYDMGYFCEAGIEVDGVWFRWSPRARQIQYREDLGDEWAHVSRVFRMEIPGILLKNIEDLYFACTSEQRRVASVLSEGTGAGGAFADKLAAELKEGNTDGRDI
jgi:hypothetical protein